MTERISQERTVRVTNVAVTDGRTITVQFEVSKPLLRFFFKSHASVTYDCPITGLPEGVLVIPFLSLIMPVAWVLDATVEVDSVDGTFADALDRIRTAFQVMYPEVPFRGQLLASERTSVEAPATAKNGVLFSGGIDSTASVIHHRDEPLILFSVIADRDEKKGFAGWINGHNREFSRLMGVNGHVVHADLDTIFDAPLICSLHKEYIHEWWAGIQHSLYFVGACAPLATLMGIVRFYIPSSHTVGEEWIRWASHPRIDNEIAWGASHVIHDLYDVGRQGKIAIVASYLAESCIRPTICVCEKLKDIGGKNCSQCEKCCRTMVGLALEGIDPNELGFRMESATTARIKQEISNGNLIRTVNSGAYWSEMKRVAKDENVLQAYDMPAFASWLRGVDFAVSDNIARRQAVYHKFVHWSAILPRFVRRPLRDFVLNIRGVEQ